MKTEGVIANRLFFPISLLLWCTVFDVGAASFESNLSKTFTVKSGGQMVMDVDRGSIQILPGDTDQVAIEVKRKISGVDKAKADDVFAAHSVKFEQDGDRVDVHASLAKDPQRWFNRRGRDLQVEYRVSLPRQFHLDLRTSAGSIRSGDIEGVVKVKTAGGSLKFGAVKGRFDGSTSAGSIELGTATGPVTAKTSGGSIALGSLEADANAQTSAGSITVDQAKAKLTVRTSGGGIQIGEAGGPTSAETFAGSIKVKSAKAVLSAVTRGGGIEIGDARDTVIAETSAGPIDASFSAPPHDDCRLATSGGSINVLLAPNLGFDVDASAVAGKVTTEIPVAMTVVGNHSGGRLQGKINGGGKALVLKTSAGGITIKKLNPERDR